jgi:hypothetical protein
MEWKNDLLGGCGDMIIYRFLVNIESKLVIHTRSPLIRSFFLFCFFKSIMIASDRIIENIYNDMILKIKENTNGYIFQF